ncbi:hypothetical protein EOM71_02750 [Candidatus Falkowbacteria bacterium]|nr:hypothetical protein [Candidatus Falkowbacteria bacterium]
MTVNNQELVSTNCLKTKKPINRRWNWQRVNRCLWLGSIVLILSYLVVANDLAAKSFALKDYKGQLAELRQQQADLQGQVALLSSYDYLRNQVQTLGMVPVDRLPYAVTNDFLAKK